LTCGDAVEPPIGIEPMTHSLRVTGEIPAIRGEAGTGARHAHSCSPRIQRGVSFDSLLVPYLRGASQITIVDPYVRMFHQARNLMELVEGIARGKDPADEVTLKLVTVENQDGPERVQRQFEYLLQIKKSAGVLGIVIDVELVDPTAIHDRSITTDTGWKILLGRGLDIFQRMSDSPFDLATKYQRYRELKGFGITYLREADE
jgi:ATP-dependent Lon protease